MDILTLHFQLAEEFKLPMTFITRASSEDFLALVKENRDKFSKGVV